jgi:hypothetical protein
MGVILQPSDPNPKPRLRGWAWYYSGELKAAAGNGSAAVVVDDVEVCVACRPQTESARTQGISCTHRRIIPTSRMSSPKPLHPKPQPNRRIIHASRMSSRRRISRSPHPAPLHRSNPTIPRKRRQQQPHHHHHHHPPSGLPFLARQPNPLGCPHPNS